MPEQDILADAFAGFTSAAEAEIASPGAGAARRTVQRRRVLAGTVAGVAVLAAVGYATLAPGRDAPPQPAGVTNPLPELPATIWSDAGRLTGGPVYSDDFRGHAAGWYQVRFMCTGGGSVTVKFAASDGAGGPTDGLPCDGKTRTVTVGLPTDTGNVWVHVSPIPEDPAGHGIWALRVDYSVTEFPTK